MIRVFSGKQETSANNYLELVWTLAKTDFKMRYHGSALGYVWAILKPLFIFLILNFVFSRMIGRGAAIPHYSLQLITGIILWNFFAEASMAGLISLLKKSSLITKIYFPRWIVVVASTLNSLFVFGMNLIILTVFFAYYQVTPGPAALLTAAAYVLGIYVLVVSFSLIAAPLYLKFRDLEQIWEVVLQVLFFAAPIVYPLSVIPEQYHKIMLLNPIGIIIHYAKIVLIEGRFPSVANHVILMAMLVALAGVSVIYFKRVHRKIAEDV